MARPASFDEQVARIALSRMQGEAKQVAGMRGLPADLRYTTPEEELDLFDHWDESVDPNAIVHERFPKHIRGGLPPDAAMVEAILEASAAGFSNRLKMAAGGGRLTLTEQTAYLEKMAMKSRARREARAKEQPPEPMTPDVPAPSPDVAPTLGG